jgi:hypothetical protein
MRKRINAIVLALEIACIVALHIFKLAAHSDKINNHITGPLSNFNKIHIAKNFTVSSLK